MIIDWQKQEGLIIENPHNPMPLPNIIEKSIILSTTGSTKPKWVVLSYDAFLASADAVNAHLNVTSEDQWLISLPLYHVGGLSILARAFLGKNKVRVTSGRWCVDAFLNELVGCTLTSLVPTQLYDLVKMGKRPPLSLRGVVIGGDRLDPSLFKQARELDWPLYQSYGMTECASQIATTRLNETELIPLKHVDLKVENGFLAVKSPSLLSGYIEGEFYDSKVDGWFVTSDRGDVDPLRIYGRDQVVKIKGELISLPEIEKLLNDFKTKVGNSTQMILFAIPDERSGHALKLFHNDPQGETFINAFNEQLPPIKRITSHQYLSELPRNSVGKICRKTLITSS